MENTFDSFIARECATAPSLFLTRAEHYALLYRDPALLKDLFAGYLSTWSIGGVTFHGIDERVAVIAREEINSALEEV